MSSIDTIVLDYIESVKPNWTDWSIWHGVKRAGVVGDYCYLCKLEIGENQEYARLSNGQRIMCYWHDSCLESLVRENPSLKGKLRL